MDGTTQVLVRPIAGAGRRELLVRRIRLLAGLSIGYNVVEAAVAIGAGTTASSQALVAFGLDSVIEVVSAAAVAWQFSGDSVRAEDRERRALRVIAAAFFALAAYVTVQALESLAGGERAGPSVPGLVLAAVSLTVMPLVSFAQRSAGRELGSASAVADSKQTLLCGCLSGALLVGLSANLLLGWAWFDPVIALVVAAVALNEGVAVLRRLLR